MFGSFSQTLSLCDYFQHVQLFTEEHQINFISFFLDEIVSITDKCWVKRLFGGGGGNKVSDNLLPAILFNLGLT